MKVSDFFKKIITTDDLSQELEMITLYMDELKKIKYPVEIEFTKNKECFAMFCINKSFLRSISFSNDLYSTFSPEEKIEIVTKAITNKTSVIAKLRYVEI